MSRNTPPEVRSGSACAQAIVRSERANLKRSGTNSRKHPRKTAKPRGSYLPEPKVLRIQERYVGGENMSAIARAEGCDRGTVARIVQFPQVRDFIVQMQQEFYGLLPDAMVAIRHALQVTKDPNVAYRVLEATGVAPHKQERLQIPDASTLAEGGPERQAQLIACVLLEGHRVYGTSFPDDVAAALAKDSREQAQLANGQKKLTRKRKKRR
jgi:hypothetical protein